MVSATSGRVTLYQRDSADPILRTWSKAFPGLIRWKVAGGVPVSLTLTMPG